jgi:Ca2+-binding RTX toxin-like protein
MRRILAALALAAIGLAPVPATAQTVHTCFGEVADTVGTSGEDTLAGDVVVGLGDEDELTGRLVCGGKGSDYYLRGTEAVDAGPGDERQIYVHGPLGIGGPGNDKFFESSAPDKQVLRGGEGNDSWVPEGADTGLDVFYGGIGNDDTRPEEGQFDNNTRQFGGEGNDSLHGEYGKDRLYGQAGDDLLTTTRPAPDNDNIADLVDGGDGFDTCRIQTGDRAVNCEDVTVAG